ncbi:MAG TPA: tetratricopeptide repeat protein [Pyrinomonadaceae bacterium]|jgi:tetratricopeptide (TPR) repeat protein|nr:tetratricopeptide repeat protein [Pyrinomonadaceae bacterium]
MKTRGHLLRFVLAGAGLVFCFGATWSAGRAGLARLLARSALETHLIAPADEAVRLGDADPEAHLSRALVLLDQGRNEEAIRGLERAARLRPRDYIIWYQLALARDRADDGTGAIAACQESLRFAPYYGRTHWLLGNLLFRAGRTEEALAELHRAAQSDPLYLPNLLELAWASSGHDAAAVLKIVAPGDRRWRLELARFFLKRGAYAEAAMLYSTAGQLSDEERLSLTKELIAAAQYGAAYELWAGGSDQSGANGRSSSGGGAPVTDGSFENPIDPDDQTFGWRTVKENPSVSISLDGQEPHAGAQSLRLDFHGDSQPASAALVSQLVTVEPGTRYRLTYAARTKGIVTGGRPLIALTDAAARKDQSALAEDAPLPQDSEGWRDYALEFTTRDNTRAILINLRRQDCGATICPIFGQLWLDSFTLRKI